MNSSYYKIHMAKCVKCVNCKDLIQKNDEDVLKCNFCTKLMCAACSSPNGADAGFYLDDDSPLFFCSAICLKLYKHLD